MFPPPTGPGEAWRFTLQLLSANVVLQFCPVLTCLKIQGDNKSISPQQVLRGMKRVVSVEYRMFVSPQDSNEFVY